MDARYDVENAKQALEHAIAGASDEEKHLHNLLKDVKWKDKVAIKRVSHPTSWRLLYVDEKGGLTDNEPVFTVYGAIAKKDLPPLKPTGRKK
ncbi:hypothetical protein C0991_002208 [Blastosporella zonata]|nr:hypothetical protein C0991_002208 [Blastosporella zonata]